MKLVIIYGPPAVGKLAVAKELVKITKFNLFHNHETRDLLASIIGTDDKIWRVTIPLRKSLIRHAINMKVKGFVFTSVFVSNVEGRKYLYDMANITEKKGGVAYFVRLVTSEEELCKRVKSKNRKNYGKFQSPMVLKAYLRKKECFDKLHHKNHLNIDNTTKSPKQVAKMIKRHFKL